MATVTAAMAARGVRTAAPAAVTDLLGREGQGQGQAAALSLSLGGPFAEARKVA